MDQYYFVKEHIDKMVNIQENLLEFLEDEKSGNLDQLLRKINYYKIRNNKSQLRTFLHLISKISDNHHLNVDFNNKLEQILDKISDDISSDFSNYDIFHIFKNNKRILLLLFMYNVLTPDLAIYSQLLKEKYRKRFYLNYFYPEFRSFMTRDLQREMKPEDESEFNDKRQINENDSQICYLIRKDNVDEFVDFVEKNNIQLHKPITHSIFETNLFLLKNQYVALIEYAAFFGSINIFRYLCKKKVIITQQLYVYAIHSNSIKIIEEIEKVLPKNKMSSMKILEESIKCYNMQMINYVKENFDVSETNKNFCFNFFNFVEIANNNYETSSSKVTDSFYYFCKYDYTELVEYFLSGIDINIGVITVSKCFFCLFMWFHVFFSNEILCLCFE